MTRRITAVAVTLALVGGAGPSVAQVRTGRDAGHRAPVIGRIGPPPPTADRPGKESPPTDQRFTSTLKFRPRHPDVEQAPIPVHAGLRRESFGVVALWSWNAVIPAHAPGAPAVVFPPSEGAPIGGLQLDVQPWGAQVYVDGTYVGVVDDFKGYYQHLDLVAGPHLIAIVAPDYQPLIIDVIVSPSRTTTYRGTLHRALGR